MGSDRPDGTRAVLEKLYDLAVARAHPRQCLPSHLPTLTAGQRLLVIGAGKAAAAMAQAAEARYGALSPDRFQGFVVTRHGSGLPLARLGLIEAGHPVPDAGSIEAARRALALAATAGADTLVLVLLSGGASALLMAPVPTVSVDAKQTLTRQLLKCGARIGEINTVRKHISRIKGGKLAAAVAASGARLITLAISDVPGDEPASIGSGPTVPDPTTLADARDVLTRYGVSPPPEVAAALADPANETLKPGAPALAGQTFTLVAAPQASLEAAAEAVRALGYRPVVLGDALEGEARDTGAAHAAMARDARLKGERIAILSGGELTVTVRGTGAGGPNQEYALALAIALAGTPGIAAIAADTDGIDGGGGNADDPAGAVVLPDTLARAASQGLDAVKFLANNDSTGFFRAAGGLVQRGGTQTNVNDFRCVLVDP
ncbi:MAG: glycerate kinase type-2 family protein [Hyphomicrobiaceae bacterium]